MLRILALLLLSAGCSTPRVWTTQRFGPVAINGDVGISSGAVSGTTSASGLGLDTNRAAWSPRVDAEFLGLHLNASNLNTDHSGQGIAEANIEFGGFTIPVNTPVRSALKLDMTTVALTFDFIPTSFLDVGVGVGAGTIKYNIDIQDLANAANRVQSNESSPMAFLAARGASTLGDFRLSLDVAWIDLNIDNTEVRFLDTDAAVAWTFFRGVGVGFGELVAGYRIIDAAFAFQDNNSNVDANLGFSGAYLGVSIGI